MMIRRSGKRSTPAARSLGRRSAIDVIIHPKSAFCGFEVVATAITTALTTAGISEAFVKARPTKLQNQIDANTAWAKIR